MGRYYQCQTTTETLAIGIKGDRDSLCGAIKRLQHSGSSWNGFLSLKEQLKCFLSANLPPNLFKYVTKDIFNLQRDEFASNYPEQFQLCEICVLCPEEKSRKRCGCPRIDAAMGKLNKCFFKLMNDKHKTSKDRIRKFQLIYNALNDEEGDWDDSCSFFLYIEPCEYYNEMDMDSTNDQAFENYQIIKDQISVQEKLLFVDVMRYFGGFETDQKQPRLILYHRREVPL